MLLDCFSWAENPLGGPGPNPSPRSSLSQSCLCQCPGFQRPVPFSSVIHTFLTKILCKNDSRVHCCSEGAFLSPTSYHLCSASKIPTTSLSFGSRPTVTKNIVIAGTSSCKQQPSCRIKACKSFHFHNLCKKTTIPSRKGVIKTTWCLWCPWLVLI